MAPKEVKAETCLDIGRFANDDVVGNLSRIPVPRQGAVGIHGSWPTTCAGLPSTRDRGGTSRVTSEPASIQAPAPRRTPLRMVALGPIHTSSSITTGRFKTGGRGRPWPRGEQAMASAMRSAGPSGWQALYDTA